MHLVARGVDNLGGHLNSPSNVVETRGILLRHGSSVGADDFDVDLVGRLLFGLWQSAIRCDCVRLTRILREGPDKSARGSEYFGAIANNLQEMHQRMIVVIAFAFRLPSYPYA